jgi:hypothetical protein
MQAHEIVQTEKGTARVVRVEGTSGRYAITLEFENGTREVYTTNGANGYPRIPAYTHVGWS